MLLTDFPEWDLPSFSISLSKFFPLPRTSSKRLGRVPTGVKPLTRLYSRRFISSSCQIWATSLASCSTRRRSSSSCCFANARSALTSSGLVSSRMEAWITFLAGRADEVPARSAQFCGLSYACLLGRVGRTITSGSTSAALPASMEINEDFNLLFGHDFFSSVILTTYCILPCVGRLGSDDHTGTEGF